MVGTKEKRVKFGVKQLGMVLSSSQSRRPEKEEVRQELGLCFTVRKF